MLILHVNSRICEKRCQRASQSDHHHSSDENLGVLLSKLSENCRPELPHCTLRGFRMREPKPLQSRTAPQGVALRSPPSSEMEPSGRRPPRGYLEAPRAGKLAQKQSTCDTFWHHIVPVGDVGNGKNQQPKFNSQHIHSQNNPVFCTQYLLI